MTKEMSEELAYAIHEAAHAAAVHLFGFKITRLRIEPELGRGECAVDRPFTLPDDAQYVRDNPRDHRTQELLPQLKRDLSCWLSGIVAEDLFEIESADPNENQQDEACAESLAGHIAHAEWARSESRVPFANREKAPAYVSRVKEFVRAKVIFPHRSGIQALSSELLSKRDLSGAQVHAFLESCGLEFNSVSDGDLP